MTEVQSILFRKILFTPREAKKWLKRNKYKPIEPPNIGKDFLRYLIKDSDSFKKFRCVPVRLDKKSRNQGVSMIIGFV